MRKLLLTTTFLFLVTGSTVIAQTGTGSSSDKQSSPWPAPTGHRQPRADQVPSEKDINNPNTAANREDAALDKKIKSICRGC